MHLVKLIIILLPGFASLSLIACSSSMGTAEDGTISECSNSSSVVTMQQPHISGTRHRLEDGHADGRNYPSRRVDSDFAQECYREPLPYTRTSPDNRTVPWDEPRITSDDGGSKCCSSLDEVRQGIDAVDEQLLLLLAKRAAYVREATRFKATHDTVDVPSRDTQVIEQAVEDAVQYGLPQVIAHSVFSAIINASVVFELCVVSNHDTITSL